MVLQVVLHKTKRPKFFARGQFLQPLKQYQSSFEYLSTILLQRDLYKK